VLGIINKTKKNQPDNADLALNKFVSIKYASGFWSLGSHGTLI